MMQTIVVSIGQLSRSLTFGLNEAFGHHGRDQIKCSYLTKTNDGKIRLYMQKVRHGYFCAFACATVQEISKRVVEQNYCQFIIIGDVEQDDNFEFIISILAYLTKVKKPYVMIFIKPSDTSKMSSIAYQTLLLSFRNIKYIQLEEFQFLYRNDPDRTMQIIRNQLVKVIEDNLLL